MARPRTPLSTSGSISLTGQVQDAEGRWVAAPGGVRASRYKARTKFRDADGVLRDVTRFARTRARAEAALKAALAERAVPSAMGQLRPDSTVEQAGSFWLRQVERADSGLSTATRSQYRASFDRYVRHSRIVGLTLREVNAVSVLEGWLQALADERGTGAAKTARSVMSGILTLAVRYNVLTHNAMRDVRPAKASTRHVSIRDTSRAFAREERDAVMKVAIAHEFARTADCADLICFLAGTGVRLGEALSQSWDDVDLGAATVLVRGTKTQTSERLLSLPVWLVSLLRDREAQQKTGVAGELVFPSPGTKNKARVRDMRNVTRVLRVVLDDAGFPWATAHTFRRTVATLLDEAGMPLVMAANQLGHSDPSMTARVYLGRRGSLAAAAGVL